jgi:predicted ester cyclase
MLWSTSILFKPTIRSPNGSSTKEREMKPNTTSSSSSSKEASKALVTRFFTEVWNSPYRMETIDELVDEEFIITSAGNDIKGRDNFTNWVQGVGSQINDLKVDIQEMIVTDDGQRVVTRMVGTGGNNGMFGTDPDNAPVSLTLISIIAVKDGKIVHNWVERSAFELHQRLTSQPR